MKKMWNIWVWKLTLSMAASMSGNPAPMTAYGVYWGIKACAKEKWEMIV